MIVFWWTGRGYATALIVFGTMMILNLALQAAPSFIPDRRWYWGLGLVAAAAVNWKVGSHLNRRWLAKSAARGLKQRLFYKAFNRFMPCRWRHSRSLSGRRNSADRIWICDSREPMIVSHAPTSVRSDAL